MTLPFSSAMSLAAARAANRVLEDYPLALRSLAAHAGKTCDFSAGPLRVRLRIDASGRAEPVGEGADAPADVAFNIEPSGLPALLRDREGALQVASFTGDSELAQLIADLVRNARWDVEEDLSRVVGDVAAHRAVQGARRARDWGRDAQSRLADNLAEYLTEELRAFIVREDHESLARAAEDLRDHLARLDARLSLLTEPTPTTP